MALFQYITRSPYSKTPTWVVVVSLLCIALVFSGELASVSALSGWWFDDLFSLWASDRTLPFDVAFNERILPDSNPPLYFSLLYFVRQLIADDGMAVIAMNIGAMIAAAVAVYIPSRRVGVSGLAVAGIAAFVLSGPVLYFAPEGRSYVTDLSIVFVTSWYAALAITGFPEQLTLIRAGILGCLAALAHVYAALSCGSLAAGLVIFALFSKRKDLLKRGLALGLSASIVFALWLGIAYSALDRIDWIEFSVRKVLTAALSVKELAIGSNVAVLIVLTLFVFGLYNAATRPLFIVFCIGFLLYAVLPVLTSFVQPIVTNRYWQIGAAALPVVVTFAAKTWIVEGFVAPRAKTLIAAAVALVFLVTSSFLGFANARHYMSSKPFWTGAEVVRPLLAQCSGAAVHIYYDNSDRPYSPWLAAIWGFYRMAGTSQTAFLDAQDDSTPWLTSATSSCPVLGWAEHAWSWEDLKDGDLMRLLKIEGSPDEVDVLRHFRGFVILKRARCMHGEPMPTSAKFVPSTTRSGSEA